jgi:hypothetical protein
MTDRFSDINPEVARAARDCLTAADAHGIGSAEHERAKVALMEVTLRVLAEHDALREASHE